MVNHAAAYTRRFGAAGYTVSANHPGPFGAVIVIPALAENGNCRKLIRSLNEVTPLHCGVLWLFVVNNTVAASAGAKADNQELLHYLRQAGSGSALSMGFIDAASPGHELPENDGGVGLARKIGMDAALRLIDFSVAAPFIACLDADCTVSSNYLVVLQRYFLAGASVLSVGFRHRFEEAAGEGLNAILCYELFLRYYVASLAWSGSPFGFQTIGSSMACTPGAYMKTEGMNKRKAGEDFYFLQKAAKAHSVTTTAETVVFPSPRGSWRVPFGTGQRVNRYLSGGQDEYLLYHFSVFEMLREWHACYYGTVQDAGGYLRAAGAIHPLLADYLEKQGFSTSLGRIIAQAKSPVQLLKQKQGWFDGFRTLKCVHYLRDNGVGVEPMFRALRRLGNACGVSMPAGMQAVPPVDEQKEWLRLLELLEKRLTAGVQ